MMDFNEESCKIISLSNDIKYLKDHKDEIWDFSKGLPTGILYKKFTGLGATTCEIDSPRHSILVFPTVSLAKSKCNQTKKRIKDEELAVQVLYVGGGVKNSSIEEFFSSISENLKVKFFVVADSLPRLIKILGSEVYETYFLMVDEIDTFQIDTSFRTSLEYAIDYFKEFKEKCALTATLIPFSDPDFDVSNIDYWIIQKDLKDKPFLEIIETTYPLEKIIDQIESLSDSGERIVVALNSIALINRIVKTLIKNGTVNNEEIGILCSEASKYKIHNEIEWFAIPEDGRVILYKKIVFMTSAYFVGIDILDVYHLIIGSIQYPEHAILQFEKIYQISGRARNGTYSNVLITPSFMEIYKKHFDVDEIKSRVFKINEILQYSKSLYSDGEYLDDFYSFNNSLFDVKIDGQEGFFRLNKDSIIVPSSFTIDYKNYFYSSILEYSISLDALVERLNEYFEVSRQIVYSDTFNSEVENYTGVDFISSFSKKLSTLINDLSLQISKNRENTVEDIFNVYLFKFIEQQKYNKKLYSAGLQFAFFIDKYQNLTVAKNEFVKFNSDKIKIKEFGELLYLYKLYNGKEYNSLKKYFELGVEYSSNEFLLIINNLTVENTGILKYFNSKKLNQSAYVLNALKNLFIVNEIPRKSISGSNKKYSKKYVILDYSSLFFERSNWSNRLKLSDYFGSSLKQFLLRLSDDEINVLLK